MRRKLFLITESSKIYTFKDKQNPEKNSKYITVGFHQILGCYKVLGNPSEPACVKRVGFLVPPPGFLLPRSNAVHGAGRAGEHPALEDSYCPNPVSISTLSHTSQLQTGITSF